MMDMNDGMGWMMAGMMGLGLLGWLIVIGLLVAIVVLLWRLVGREQHERDSRRPPASPNSAHR